MDGRTIAFSYHPLSPPRGLWSLGRCTALVVYEAGGRRGTRLCLGRPAGRQAVVVMGGVGGDEYLYPKEEGKKRRGSSSPLLSLPPPAVAAPL